MAKAKGKVVTKEVAKDKVCAPHYVKKAKQWVVTEFKAGKQVQHWKGSESEAVTFYQGIVAALNKVVA